MYEIIIEDSFPAAHFLKLYDGSWEERHDHDWKVSVVMRAEKLDSIGVVMDFGALKTALKNILAEFHGRSFNDHPDFKGKLNTSAENIAKKIYDCLALAVRSDNAKIAKVTVWETSDASASYLP